LSRREFIYAKETHHLIRKVLGKRPGDYHLDPDYIRTGMGDKPYFWNAEHKRWELVRLGDLFILNEDGSVDRIPVAQVRGKVS
jgi:hypothetical protein